MADISAPLPWEKRTSSVWAMPGGQSKYLDNLSEICLWVEQHLLSSKEELITKVEAKFNIKSVYARNCVNFLKKAGIIQLNNNGTLQLPKQVSHWMETKDNTILISIFHHNIRFIGEMLAELKEPKSVSELHNVAAEKYGFNWKANYQEVDNRYKWLMSANLVKRINDKRIAVTDAGRELLSKLEVFTPAIPRNEQRYWLMALGERSVFWNDCYKSRIACIGWDYLGDLRDYETREDIDQAMGGGHRHDSLACWEFSREMKPGDIIFVKLGRESVIGHGIIESDYRFDDTKDEYKNVRDVQWLSNHPEGVKVREKMLVTKTLTDITKYPEQVEAIKMALEIEAEHDELTIPYSIDSILEDGCFLERSVLEQLLQRLKMKKNLILQGPPGTGKTWLAKRLAYAFIGEKNIDRVRAVQFHPNLSYEDFVCGWRPTRAGNLKLTNGVFMRAIQTALDNPSDAFVIVIEEINRGNPAQIFGELITLLEADKRNPEEAIELAYSGEGNAKPVYIPDNLYVIGTMNIADRSLALVDLALRRRFAFASLEPLLGERWREWVISERGVDERLADDIKNRMSELNGAIENDLGEQYRIGHSYVTPADPLGPSETKTWFEQIVNTEIGPLLEEYWFDSPEKAREQCRKLLQNW